MSVVMEEPAAVAVGLRGLDGNLVWRVTAVEEAATLAVHRGGGVSWWCGLLDGHLLVLVAEKTHGESWG